MKSSKSEHQVTYPGRPIRVTADNSNEMQKPGRLETMYFLYLLKISGNDVFSVLKDNYQLPAPYPAKLPATMEGKIKKTFCAEL